MESSTNSKSATNQLVEVTLLKPHTHAGKSYGANSQAEVTLPVAQWLHGHGIISAADLAKAKKTLGG